MKTSIYYSGFTRRFYAKLVTKSKRHNLVELANYCGTYGEIAKT